MKQSYNDMIKYIDKKTIKYVSFSIHREAISKPAMARSVKMLVISRIFPNKFI